MPKSACVVPVLRHCDTTVTGGAEGAWPALVRDAARGELRRRYDGATSDVFTPALYARPRFDFFRHRDYIFPVLRDFVRASGLAEVQVTVLTPFPGTPLYARLKHENRLLKGKFWNRCTLFDVNYRPAGMTVEDLEQGMRWLFSELYSGAESSNRLRSFAQNVIRHK